MAVPVVFNDSALVFCKVFEGQADMMLLQESEKVNETLDMKQKLRCV